MTRKKSAVSPGAVISTRDEVVGSPKSTDCSLSLSLSDLSSSSSAPNKTDSNQFFDGGNEFFKGYRAGLRVQFEDDQVIMDRYRDKIRQLQQEVEEYRRQEVIKEEGRRREREVERRIRLDLENEKVELERLRQEQEKDKRDIIVNYVRCRRREARYRERLANLTKDLAEANDRALAMQVAYGGDVVESWQWDYGPEWEALYRSPTDESSDLSTESSILSLESGFDPKTPESEAPEIFYIDSDEEREVSYIVEHAAKLDVSNVRVTAQWKGKGREIDFDSDTQNRSGVQRPSSNERNPFDIEIDVDTGISDSGSSGSDVELESDAKSLSGESVSSISFIPVGFSTTPIQALPAPTFVSKGTTLLTHETPSRSHISISELDAHQLMALMKAAHEDGYQPGDSEASTSLKTVRHLISEAEKVPRQRRNALEIYLLTNWRSPSGRKRMLLPDPPNQSVAVGEVADALVPAPISTHNPSKSPLLTLSIPTIFVDASGYGIGLFMPDGRWLAWAFNIGHPRIPIAPDKQIVMSWAELVAVELGILTLIAAGHKNTRILVRSDNDGVVGALLRRTWTNSYGLNVILGRILSLCNKPSKIPGQGRSPNNLDLSVKWVRSQENPADGPSRGIYPSKELMLKDHPAIPEYLVGVVRQII